VCQGHISLVKGFLYWVAQISGGIVGTLLTVKPLTHSICTTHKDRGGCCHRVVTLRCPHAVALQVGLKPGLTVGTTALACFVPGTDVTKAQSFGW
jgi:glycerol uptake facilitator-like aquaporin